MIAMAEYLVKIQTAAGVMYEYPVQAPYRRRAEQIAASRFVTEHRFETTGAELYPPSCPKGCGPFSAVGACPGGHDRDGNPAPGTPGFQTPIDRDQVRSGDVITFAGLPGQPAQRAPVEYAVSDGVWVIQNSLRHKVAWYRVTGHHAQDPAPHEGVIRDADGTIVRGPSLPCGCPLDSGCTGHHPGRL